MFEPTSRYSSLETVACHLPDGREVFVRDIAEQHVLEDLGHIPSLSDWLREMPPLRIVE